MRGIKSLALGSLRIWQEDWRAVGLNHDFREDAYITVPQPFLQRILLFCDLLLRSCEPLEGPYHLAFAFLAFRFRLLHNCAALDYERATRKGPLEQGFENEDKYLHKTDIPTSATCAGGG